MTPVAIAGGGAFDCWQPWGETTCGNPAGCVQTIPTTFTGWKNSYDVISDALTAVSVNESPLAPAEEEPTGEAFLQDYWLANASVVDRYHVDVVLWDRHLALVTVLRATGHWNEVFTKGGWTVLQRT